MTTGSPNDEDVILRREGAVGRITLNRPKALNTLTLPMCAAMLNQLRAWAEDDAVRAVLIDAVRGRAFCAGGDIRALHDSAAKGDGKASEFFTTEYRLNATIHRYPKPYVALIDGYAFGGGLGVSVHGSHRVVSENASLSMPETAIGLFPDIGASYFLNRLPGQIGMYLALTGVRVNAADALYAGLATHFVPSAHLADIVRRLTAGEPPGAVLAGLAADPGPAPLADNRPAIDRAFAARTVEKTLEALRREGEWGRETAALLETRSPESLKATFREMREGAALDLEDCLRMEYRLMARMVESHNFTTGMRAALIDRNQAPQWRPSRLDAVDDNEIARFFAPLAEGDWRFA